MQRSLTNEINKFNDEVLQFENDQVKDIIDLINLIESINPELKNFADHLKLNLYGLLGAASSEEVQMYCVSFKKALSTFSIDTDVLGIVQSSAQLRIVMDAAREFLSTNKPFDLSEAIKTIVDEFQKKENELLKEITERSQISKEMILNKIEQNKHSFDKSSELNELEIQIIKLKEDQNRLEEAQEKIKQIKEEMQKAQNLVQEAMKSASLNDLADKRAKLEEQLINIRDIAFAKQEFLILQKYLAEMTITRIDALATVRSTYLEEIIDPKKITQDFAWMGAGAAVTTVGIVISAPTVVVGFGLGGLLYGAGDLAKTIVETKDDASDTKLGHFKKTISTISYNPSTNELRMIEKAKKSRSDRAKEIGKKSVPVALSALGLGLGIAAVIAIGFPPIGIPLAMASLVVTGIGVAMYGRELYLKHKNFKAAQKRHDEIQAKFEMKPITKTENKNNKAQEQLHQELSSSSLIDLFLLGSRINNKLTVEQKQKLLPQSAFNQQRKSVNDENIKEEAINPNQPTATKNQTEIADNPSTGLKGKEEEHDDDDDNNKPETNYTSTLK